MYDPLNPLQSREYANTVQLHESMLGLLHEQRSNRGSMVWMRQRGRDYLMRSSYGANGKRIQRSLGPRSPETEAILQRFEGERLRISQKAAALTLRESQQAALNRAVGLSRIPEISGKIVRALVKSGFDAKRFRIVGTHALYVYEMLAAAHFRPELTTTLDINILVDPRAPLRILVGEGTEDARILSALRLADRSFEIGGERFRAQNRDGFMVDFITPLTREPWRHARLSLHRDDVALAMLEGLQWLENAPLVQALCIDTRGARVSLSAPDPRVFAIHKFWLSSQPGREPYKARRDRAQATAVSHLLRRELPHLAFDLAALRMIPRSVAETAIAALSRDANA